MQKNFTIGRRAVLLASAIALGFGALAMPAQAEYPEKPVEMTILFGGTSKAIGQLLADQMSKVMTNPVVPVSRPGGGGAVGYTYVKGTTADGYNIVWNSNSISTAYYKGNMPLTYKDFVPIARVSIEAPVLAVRSETGWKTVKEMVDAAKSDGRKLKIGISGKGAFTHVVSAALFQKLDVPVIYIPYGKGKAPAELLGGRIDAALQWPGQFISHAKAGKVNLIGVTSGSRVPVIPDVMTVKEQGVDMDMTMWRGLAAPKGTPPEAVKALQAAAEKAVASEAFQTASKKLGFKIDFLPADEFGTLIAEDDVRISEVMEEIGLKKQ